MDREKYQLTYSKFFTSPWYIIVISMAVIVGLLCRIMLLNRISFDYESCLKVWYGELHDYGYRALGADTSNYNPTYLYILWFVAKQFPKIPTLIAVKSISIFFDVICSLIAYKLVKLKYTTGINPIIAFASIFLAPTVILNSAWWAQCDVIYTTGLLLFIYCLLNNRNEAAMTSYAFAFSTKLQAIFLVPLILIMLLRKKISWAHVSMIPMVYIILLLPAWLAGRPLLQLLTIYIKQGTIYNELSKGAPNLYTWFPDTLFPILCPLGILLASVFIIIFCYSVYKEKIKLGNDIVIQLAAFFAVTIPFILPKMHERYFFPADILLIVLAFFRPRFIWLAVIMSTVSLLSYLPYLCNVTIIPIQLLSLGPLCIIWTLIQDFERQGVWGTSTTSRC